MVILFIPLPKWVYLPHNTMEFFDFILELKVNEYDQLNPRLSELKLPTFLKSKYFCWVNPINLGGLIVGDTHLFSWKTHTGSDGTYTKITFKTFPCGKRGEGKRKTILFEKNWSCCLEKNKATLPQLKWQRKNEKNGNKDERCKVITTNSNHVFSWRTEDTKNGDKGGKYAKDLNLINEYKSVFSCLVFSPKMAKLPQLKGYVIVFWIPNWRYEKNGDKDKWSKVNTTNSNDPT